MIDTPAAEEIINRARSEKIRERKGTPVPPKKRSDSKKKQKKSSKPKAFRKSPSPVTRSMTDPKRPRRKYSAKYGDYD